MPSITIVITDQPKGQGFTVLTDSAAPGIGLSLSPAQAFTNALLRACSLQAESIQYGTPSATLAGELVAAAHAISTPSKPESFA
jgi:hypothetical protein